MWTVRLAVAVLLAFTAVSRADVVLDWNTVTLDAIRAERTNPPMATRVLAMVHTAMYDAVNAIDRAHEPYFIEVEAAPTTSRVAAAASAAHEVLVHLYPSLSPTFDAHLRDSLKQVYTSEPDREAGIALGRYVAERIIAWREADGWDRVVNYEPGTEPGQWRPTPPDFAPALFPQWPQVTPWGMTSGSQFRAAPPPALPSVEYAADFNEVKSLGRVDSPIRTPDQTEIAIFWEDGPGTCTPPGHWNLIAQNCARELGYGLGRNAWMFAMLNVALADAAISCWDTKYEFDLWRPVTAIHLADQDGNPLTEPDPDWMPLLYTPPFPEYTSGHSTFSSAGATVLAFCFGTDRMTFIDESDAMPGVYRTFHSFSEAAAEAGRSRIYGGIHYEFANQHATEAGQWIGQFVAENHFRPVGSRPVLVQPSLGLTGYVNRFEVFHAQPGEPVGFLWGLRSGAVPVPRCPGVFVDIVAPQVFARVRADAGGYATADRLVPIEAQGRAVLMQTVHPGSCAVSDVIEFTFHR